MSEKDYYQKYLKYKTKYEQLKQIGGIDNDDPKTDVTIFKHSDGRDYSLENKVLENVLELFKINNNEEKHQQIQDLIGEQIASRIDLIDPEDILLRWPENCEWTRKYIKKKWPNDCKWIFEYRDDIELVGIRDNDDDKRIPIFHINSEKFGKFFFQIETEITSLKSNYFKVVPKELKEIDEKSIQIFNWSFW